MKKISMLFIMALASLSYSFKTFTANEPKKVLSPEEAQVLKNRRVERAIKAAQEAREAQAAEEKETAAYSAPFEEPLVAADRPLGWGQWTFGAAGNALSRVAQMATTVQEKHDALHPSVKAAVGVGLEKGSLEWKKYRYPTLANQQIETLLSLDFMKKNPNWSSSVRWILEQLPNKGNEQVKKGFVKLIKALYKNENKETIQAIMNEMGAGQSMNRFSFGFMQAKPFTLEEYTTNGQDVVKNFIVSGLDNEFQFNLTFDGLTAGINRTEAAQNDPQLPKEMAKLKQALNSLAGNPYSFSFFSGQGNDDEKAE